METILFENKDLNIQLWAHKYDRTYYVIKTKNKTSTFISFEYAFQVFLAVVEEKIDFKSIQEYIVTFEVRTKKEVCLFEKDSQSAIKKAKELLDNKDAILISCREYYEDFS